MAIYGNDLSSLQAGATAAQDADTRAKAQQLMYLLNLAQNRTANAKLGSDERINSRRYQSEDTRTQAEKDLGMQRTGNDLTASTAGNSSRERIASVGDLGAREMQSEQLKNAMAIETMRLQAAKEQNLAAAQAPNPALLQAIGVDQTGDETRNLAANQVFADSLTAGLPFQHFYNSGPAARQAAEDRLESVPQLKGRVIIAPNGSGGFKFIANPESKPAGSPGILEQIQMSRPGYRPPTAAPAPNAAPAVDRYSTIRAILGSPAPTSVSAPVAPAKQPVLYDQNGNGYYVDPQDVQGYIQRGFSPTPPSRKSSIFDWMNIQ